MADGCAEFGDFHHKVSITDYTTFYWTSNMTAKPPTFSGAMVVSRVEVGWMAIGFNRRSDMGGTDAVIGVVELSGTPNCVFQYNVDEQGVEKQRYQNLTEKSITVNGEQTTMTFTRPIEATDKKGLSLDMPNLWVVWAHSADASIAQHTIRRRGTIRPYLTLDYGNFTGCVSAEEGALEANGSNGVNYNAAYAHGICMAIAFGFFMPLSIMMARYRPRKRLRRFRFHRDINDQRDNYSDNGDDGIDGVAAGADVGGAPMWLQLHIGLHMLAFTLTVVGLALIVNWVTHHWNDHHFSSPHGKAGMGVMVMVFIQILGGMVRPHAPPHESMAKNALRRIWESSHRVLAAAILAFGIYQVFDGIGVLGDVIDEQHWSVAFILVLALMAAAFVALEIVQVVSSSSPTPSSRESVADKTSVMSGRTCSVKGRNGVKFRDDEGKGDDEALAESCATREDCKDNGWGSGSSEEAVPVVRSVVI